MGMSPAPTLANLFVAINKHKHILLFILTVVMYFCQLIDDDARIDFMIQTLLWMRTT
jgi:hypothetical protein